MFTGNPLEIHWVANPESEDEIQITKKSVAIIAPYKNG